ncbi:MAG TPA: DUF5009 domain-containing protein [Acidimicrobiales bacterium]|nr:DUF5009 domain-containing protein [Acidimicrobiales bacterium]
MAEPARLQSLDVLRGATIAAMVLVNDPAMGPPYLYHQLTHSPWNGWTFADTIFPAFLFMVGVAMPFSLARHLDGRAPKRSALLRIGRRVLLLVALGLLVNGFPLLLGDGHSVLGTLRLPGVLQRIAIAYLVAAVAVLFLRPRHQAVLAAALLVGYWAALRWAPVPGYGAGSLTPHGNLAAWVDRTVFGRDHMYGGGVPGYDPEGLLGSVVAAAGVLFGNWAGMLLRARHPRRFTVAVLLTAAVGASGAGLLWSHDVPINKRMWTPSYVLLMTGLCLAALALCHVVFDRRSRVAGAAGLPFRVLGANAVVVYFGSELSAAALAHYHHAVKGIPDAPIPFWIWLRYLTAPFGTTGGALAYAGAVLLLWWIGLAVLYRRRWFLRV